MRLSCVLYFLMVEKAESSFGASPVGVNIWAPFRSALRSSRFVFLYVVSALRSALRLVSRLALASRAMPTCVSFCVPLGVFVSRIVFRLVVAFRFPCLPVGDGI